MLAILIVVVVSLVYTSIKIHQIVHLKCVQFTVQELYTIKLFGKKISVCKDVSLSGTGKGRTLNNSLTREKASTEQALLNNPCLPYFSWLPSQSQPPSPEAANHFLPLFSLKWYISPSSNHPFSLLTARCSCVYAQCTY